MCFSASASFTAAAGLALASLASFRKVRNVRQLMFGSIPFLFAVQQFSEGLIWLVSSGKISSDFQPWPSTLFLIFAFVIWPFWIPTSLYLMEKEHTKKRWLRFLMFTGWLMSAVVAWVLSKGDILSQITANNVCYSVSSFKLFASQWPYLLLYLVPTILPFFVSSYRKMWLFGVAGLLSCFITLVFNSECFISVWCFFAAVLSFMLIALFPKE